MSVEVLTVSSKGQIVLPIKMRKAIGISDGDKLAAYTSDDGVIMLKIVKIPTVQDFKTNLQEAENWAKSVGYQEIVTEMIDRKQGRLNKDLLFPFVNCLDNTRYRRHKFLQS